MKKYLAIALTWGILAGCRTSLLRGRIPMDEKLEINDGQIAEAFLRGSGLSVMDAARLALELLEARPAQSSTARARMEYYRRIIRLGAEACAQEGHTVSFREALEKSLLSRAGRRRRTLSEIRQCCRRILHDHPELASMLIRYISSEYCRQLIMQSYHTPSTQRKARRLLYGLFAFCMRNGWCSSNPVAAVEIPIVQEKTVNILSLQQVRHLLATARRPEHIACAPAVGIMLWAGIRPTELTRLRWQDVHVEDHVITVEACHSKTGGARHVTLLPVLIKWLKETAPFRLPGSHIVPRAWVRRWRALRLAAGFDHWHPDTLRHTFASYHLKYFRDYKSLQVDMGHADVQLLRTRYLSMKGLTIESAAAFWGKRVKCKKVSPEE